MPKLDRDDALFILGTFIPVILWWFLKGQKKYGSKGMH